LHQGQVLLLGLLFGRQGYLLSVQGWQIFEKQEESLYFVHTTFLVLSAPEIHISAFPKLLGFTGFLEANKKIKLKEVPSKTTQARLWRRNY